MPGKVTVREVSTGREFLAWPVDAREMVRSGEYETPAWKDVNTPAFPMGKAVSTAALAGIKRARELPVADSSAPAVASVPPILAEPAVETPAVVEPVAAVASPAPRRGRRAV